MMKKLIQISSYILIIILFASCEKWLDVNDDPNSPKEEDVNESIYLPGIEGVISYELSGGYPARVPNFWVGQITVNSTYSEYRFNVNGSRVAYCWKYSVYTDALRNSLNMLEVAEKDGNYHYQGIAKVMIAYTLAMTTDLWGEIPWSQAFQPDINLFPAFDSQEYIYNEIHRLLNEAISDFDQPAEGQSRIPGSEDLIYEGNIDNWRKLAYTLKARYFLRLTYAPGMDPEELADSVLSALAGGFESNDDNAGFTFLDKTDGESPWHQWNKDWRALYSNAFMVDLMDSLDDPRIHMYFDQTANGDYVGLLNGDRISDLDLDSLIISPLSEYILAPDQTIYWCTYDEAKFMEAEAYLWKNDMVNANNALDEAIRSNMIRMNVIEGDINAFITNIGDLPADFEEAQRMIIEEKYISNFLSPENYNDYRRTGYPLVSADDTDNPYFDIIPVRLPYSEDVQYYNPDHYVDVNLETDKLWWDGKPD